MKLHLKRRTLLILIITTVVSTWIIIELLAEALGVNQAFHYFVVTGNGEGKITGYFGWVGGSRTYVQVLPSADIESIAQLAEASGYETIAVRTPANYDPYPPRVVIRNRVTLYPTNVPINFTIIVREDGYLTIDVHSQYYLRDDWMRAVFRRMLRDINLSQSIISRFTLAENGIVTWDTFKPSPNPKSCKGYGLASV